MKKKLQEAVETSRKEDKPESPEEINAGQKSAFDYLDIILAKNAKLSGIIDCLRGFSSEIDGSIDFINLAWAMKDYTDAIEELTNDLWKYLRDVGALSV